MAGQLDLDICARLDSLLSIYHRVTPVALDAGDNWTEKPGLLQLPPDLVRHFAFANPGAFQEGVEDKPEVSPFDPGHQDYVRSLRLSLSILEKSGIETFTTDLAGLFGSAYAHLEQGDEQTAREVMHVAQRHYFLLNWAKLTERQTTQPVVVLGNPLLHVPSKRIDFDTVKRERLDAIAALLELKQRELNAAYENPVKTSVLGACQVHPFASGAMVPPAAASIAFAGSKFENHLVLYNPRAFPVTPFDGMYFASPGWYGDFTRRSMSHVPEILRIEYQDISGQEQFLVFNREQDGVCKIFGSEIPDQPIQGVHADPVIALMVMGQLMQGHTPYDFFVDEPQPFTGSEATDIKLVRGPGFYPTRSAYDKAKGTEQPSIVEVVRQTDVHTLTIEGGEERHYIPDARPATGVSNLREDLETLVSTPGPSQHITRTHSRHEGSDLRLAPGYELPFYLAVRDMLLRIGDGKGIDLSGNILSHGGNIVVTSDPEMIGQEAHKARKPRVNIVCHGDEITYYIGKQLGEDTYVLKTPFAPQKIVHDKVKIYGFRGTTKREFVQVGEGTVEKVEGVGYVLTTRGDVRDVDVAIQDYGPTWKNVEGTGPVLYSKAIDPRASTVAGLYAVAELLRQGLDTTLIIAGDEEGNPTGEWAKWLAPTALEFCSPDDIMLLTDGYDGKQLTETPEGEYETRVLLPGTLSDGKGGGNLGLTRLLIDMVPYMENVLGIGVRSSTGEYCSRNNDLPLQRLFPNLLAAQWSNGPAGDKTAVCHSDESIALRQVANLTRYLTALPMVLSNMQRDYGAIELAMPHLVQ